MAISQLEKRQYLEALMKPKFEKSLDRLLNKYDYLMADHHFQTKEEVADFVKRTLEEGNSVLILPEYLGHCITVWR